MSLFGAMRIFDDIERTYSGPALHNEDRFAYYNRSARVGVVRIRALLERWFERYPEAQQTQLARAFRDDFYSAFLELLFHELAIRLGAVVEVHPMLLGSARRPDFGIADRAGKCYLEARTAYDASDLKTGQDRVIGFLYDEINKMSIPDYFLDLVDLSLLSRRQPSARRICGGIATWISTLEYEDVCRKAQQSIQSLPEWTYGDDSIKLTVRAMPVSNGRRGDPDHQPIGIYPSEARWGGTKAVLRKALERKGTRYGTVEEPFLIAVNCLSPWGDDAIDRAEALFGSERVVVGGRAKPGTLVHSPDGFWNGPNGPQHTRVSGVIFGQVVPWNLHVAEVRLYHNPWAVNEYTGVFTEMPQAHVRNGRVQFTDGVMVKDVLGLQTGWLGE